MLNPPQGYFAYNLYPTLKSTENDPVYDANFIPGFEKGLTNISINWSSGIGYGRIGYSVGPWQYLQVGMPHLAVGPQCCNFKEIPRTQQYRRVDWGDYYYVKAGFISPGVNVPNFTTDFSVPAYVGLRTDWRWVVSISLDWSFPRLLNPGNEWAAIGIAATQYVPSTPDKLVYTVVDFWKDANSTSAFERNSKGPENHEVVSSRVVVYHPLQLSETGNQTITLNLSPYLEDTLQVLNLTGHGSDPPVISYVYLNVEGYNVHWNSTLYSFFVMSNHDPSEQGAGGIPPFAYYALALILVAASAVLFYSKKVHLHESKQNRPKGYSSLNTTRD
jgi:hypothetical protein